jgi:hypothetical protein
MRLKTISKRVSALEAKQGRNDFTRAVDYVLYQAIQNAEDTAVGNPEFTERDYEQVAMSSLEVLLAGSKEIDVQAWYRSQGFRW